MIVVAVVNVFDRFPYLTSFLSQKDAKKGEPGFCVEDRALTNPDEAALPNATHVSDDYRI